MYIFLYNQCKHRKKMLNKDELDSFLTDAYCFLTKQRKKAKISYL